MGKSCQWIDIYIANVSTQNFGLASLYTEILDSHQNEHHETAFLLDMEQIENEMNVN